MNKQLVVLQRGYVLVGVPDHREYFQLDNVSVVRRWGTDQGVGQLVNGPTRNTVLDPIPGTVEIGDTALLMSFNVANFPSNEDPGPPVDSKTRLYVLDRGWILVGRVYDANAEAVTLSKAVCLRRWGTSRGLGELTNGPTPQSTIDPLPADVRVPRHGIIFAFPVTGWDAHV